MSLQGKNLQVLKGTYASKDKIMSRMVYLQKHLEDTLEQ